MSMSTLPTCSTTSSGCLRIILLVSRPKYSSSVRSFTTNSPVPGFMRTRAIDSLRRPVAVTSNSLVAIKSSSSPGGRALRGRRHRGGLLRGVRVLVARVHLELLHQGASEVGAREHAAHGVLDEPGRVTRHGLLRGDLAEAAGELGVVDVLLVLPLVAGEPDLLGVHHHHEIAAIRVGREGGLVLAAQDARDGGRSAAQHLVLHVDHHPVARDGALATHHGLHPDCLQKGVVLYWIGAWVSTFTDPPPLPANGPKSRERQGYFLRCSRSASRRSLMRASSPDSEGS